MAKINVIAACNDVLFDDDKNPSLINVFSALEAQDISGAAIDSKTLAPRNWCVFTMWRAESGDIGRTFTQQLQVLTPDGTQFGYGSEKFQMEKLVHSIIMRIKGFPIGLEGDVVVKVWLEVGMHKETKITNLPINVKHIKPKILVTK